MDVLLAFFVPVAYGRQEDSGQLQPCFAADASFETGKRQYSGNVLNVACGHVLDVVRRGEAVE